MTFAKIGILSFALLSCVEALACGCAQARLLEGGLQQSQSLPPLSDKFREGGTFDERLDHAEELDDWVIIPHRSEERRIAPFAPVDNIGGNDLREGFQRFMQSMTRQNAGVSK